MSGRSISLEPLLAFSSFSTGILWDHIADMGLKYSCIEVAVLSDRYALCARKPECHPSKPILKEAVSWRSIPT